MDLVEFLMAIERRFNLTIPEADASGITTPSKLIDYWASRLGATGGPGVCLTQRAFYRVREGFTRGLGTPRNAVHPLRALAALVPTEARRESWARLQAATGATEWPDLCRPRWLFWALVALSAVSAVTAGAGAYPVLGKELAVSAGLSAWILAGVALARVTVRWKTELPATQMVVGVLARAVLAHTAVEGQDHSWTRPQIASVVHALIADVLGITEYTEDSRWVEDMRLGD
jgi:hypothetical protein